ncbi:YeeE/YedE thiosulfate transporter family protein [Methanoregula sp.]|uniref:YeeE/YedE thiosulfate transporter family protein n=1 Tax=Methanoregula sp. TaxID=2052170 RepID=UPI003C1A8126
MAFWSPYLVGAGIGILACLSFVFARHPLGCTTAFVKVRGLIDRVLDRTVVERLEYYRLFVPAIDGQVMVIAGIVIGAGIAALLLPQAGTGPVPSLWAATFGPSLLVRLAIAFIGGMLLIIGARWAGGCMCGHGISGTAQLSVASYLTLFATFFSGIAVALVLFRLAGV